MIASLRSDLSAPETSVFHGCVPLNIPPPLRDSGLPVFVAGGEPGADDSGDAALPDDESDSPVNMIATPTPTTMTAMRAPATSQIFLVLVTPDSFLGGADSSDDGCAGVA
jgi:hypothetical protein